MGKIPVKLFSIWASGSGGDIVYLFFFSAVMAILLGGAEPSVQFR